MLTSWLNDQNSKDDLTAEEALKRLEEAVDAAPQEGIAQFLTLLSEDPHQILVEIPLYDQEMTEIFCRIIDRLNPTPDQARTLSNRFPLSWSLSIMGGDPFEGRKDQGRGDPISAAACEAVERILLEAHAAGLVHGDVTRRNLTADATGAELFDWEPILVAPGPAPALDPAPERVTGPTRWLGGCDLIGLVDPGARVTDLDLFGVHLLRAGRA